jgi:hypothetical protein
VKVVVVQGPYGTDARQRSPRRCAIWVEAPVSLMKPAGPDRGRGATHARAPLPRGCRPAPARWRGRFYECRPALVEKVPDRGRHRPRGPIGLQPLGDLGKRTTVKKEPKTARQSLAAEWLTHGYALNPFVDVFYRHH